MLMVESCSPTLLRHLQRSRDLDAAAEGSGHWARLRVHGQHPLGHFPLGRVDPQMIAHVDAPNDQDLAVQLDLACSLGPEPAVPGWDPARLQRAPEGSSESAGRRGHDVVERRRVGCVHGRVHTVVLGNLRVNAKQCRPCLHRQIGSAERTLHPLDPHM